MHLVPDIFKYSKCCNLKTLEKSFSLKHNDRSKLLILVQRCNGEEQDNRLHSLKFKVSKCVQYATYTRALSVSKEQFDKFKCLRHGVEFSNDLADLSVKRFHLPETFDR